MRPTSSRPAGQPRIPAAARRSPPVRDPAPARVFAAPTVSATYANPWTSWIARRKRPAKPCPMSPRSNSACPSRHAAYAAKPTQRRNSRSRVQPWRASAFSAPCGSVVTPPEFVATPIASAPMIPKHMPCAARPTRPRRPSVRPCAARRTVWWVVARPSATTRAPLLVLATRDRALELLLVHRRAAVDLQPRRRAVELLARAIRGRLRFRCRLRGTGRRLRTRLRRARLLPLRRVARAARLPRRRLGARVVAVVLLVLLLVVTLAVVRSAAHQLARDADGRRNRDA